MFTNFYTPIINCQKGKLRKQSHLQLHLKVPRNKFNQGAKRNVLRKIQDTEEIEEDANKWKHTL